MNNFLCWVSVFDNPSLSIIIVYILFVFSNDNEQVVNTITHFVLTKIKSKNKTKSYT